MVGLLVVLRIYVASAVFQPYRDLEAGDNQPLKIQVVMPGIEPGSFCSASQELNHSATATPPRKIKPSTNSNLFSIILDGYTFMKGSLQCEFGFQGRVPERINSPVIRMKIENLRKHRYFDEKYMKHNRAFMRRKGNEIGIMATIRRCTNY